MLGFCSSNTATASSYSAARTSLPQNENEIETFSAGSSVVWGAASGLDAQPAKKAAVTLPATAPRAILRERDFVNIIVTFRSVRETGFSPM